MPAAPGVTVPLLATCELSMLRDAGPAPLPNTTMPLLPLPMTHLLCMETVVRSARRMPLVLPEKLELLMSATTLPVPVGASRTPPWLLVMVTLSRFRRSMPAEFATLMPRQLGPRNALRRCVSRGH
jgi:hypothetical protein